MENFEASPDFEAMQQQAIRRVKEMQQRAVPLPEPTSSPEPKAPKPEPPHQTPTPPKPQRKRASPLSSLFHLDSDVSLILPLLLLLSREGADDALLLALLYIMA